jgi:3'(2'), 5'-bisphosphate nucleotidase
MAPIPALSSAAAAADYVPIQVAQLADRSEWRFVESVEAAHGHPARQEAVAQAVGFTRPPLRMDSQVKYGAVARGDAALYLRLPSPHQPDYREKIWDHAAGALIVEEASGCVTDMYGYPLDFASGYRMHANRGVVASNGALHLDVIEALR